ncbi:MAG: hypothetical protein HC925_08960 [Coleofasciculaceae cyanobacterium SM2_3_26]|nr:hypothetical protein [Coleofasciculaceae cyanobacterium SM2_3_26]
MSQGELCAIPLRELPSMMDIPVSEVRPLPETFNGLRLVGLASHVALLPQEGRPLEIFLLNMRKLAEMMHVASLLPGR